MRNKSAVDYSTQKEKRPEALEDFVSKFSYSGVEEQPHEENMNTHRESREELKVPKSRNEQRGRSRERTNSRGNKRGSDMKDENVDNTVLSEEEVNQAVF